MGNQDRLLGQADAHASFALHRRCQTSRVNQDDLAGIRVEHFRTCLPYRLRSSAFIVTYFSPAILKPVPKTFLGSPVSA